MSVTTAPQTDATTTRQDAAWLDAHWMPFTANRQFKKAPRLLASASGMYYTTVDGRKLLDAAAYQAAADADA